jgi:hypothetical protein
MSLLRLSRRADVILGKPHLRIIMLVVWEKKKLSLIVWGSVIAVEQKS